MPSETKSTALVRLYAEASAVPAGGALMRLPAGATATTIVVDDRAELHAALPPVSLAEKRWLLDQAVRRLAALADFARYALAAAPAITDDELTTFALDLHNRSGGAIDVRERPAVADRVARVGALEDGYRAWIDEDPATRTSIAIGRDVTAWAQQRGNVEVEVFDDERLGKLGMRLLLAVGRGSDDSPPRLVLAHYRPENAAGKPLMLLGKGITFDSGGINVKPYESFVSMMKNDMGGASLAFHLFRGLVESGFDRPLVLVIPTCENAVDGRSMRPGALVESYRGHKVRIDHTDAEGRLVMADGLAYASERFEPDQIITFATLTTAALNSYGPYATPVHFADADLQARMENASAATGEDLHFFPERVWHLEANRDKEADLRNTARLPGHAARGAGSRNAAHFLKHFTDAPLCHLDIFASTWNWAGDAPGAGYGATGAPLRTLLRAFGVQ